MRKLSWLPICSIVCRRSLKTRTKVWPKRAYGATKCGGIRKLRSLGSSFVVKSEGEAPLSPRSSVGSQNRSGVFRPRRRFNEARDSGQSTARVRFAPTKSSDSTAPTFPIIGPVTCGASPSTTSNTPAVCPARPLPSGPERQRSAGRKQTACQSRAKRRAGATCAAWCHGEGSGTIRSL